MYTRSLITQIISHFAYMYVIYDNVRNFKERFNTHINIEAILTFPDKVVSYNRHVQTKTYATSFFCAATQYRPAPKHAATVYTSLRQ